MTNHNTIILAALGGALIGGLIAAIVGEIKKEESFPLSPSTGLNDFPDSDYTNSELGSRPERRGVSTILST